MTKAQIKAQLKKELPNLPIWLRYLLDIIADIIYKFINDPENKSKIYNSYYKQQHEGKF
jgi:hypothetical protein